MTDKLDRIPEEVRARLAAILLKSIGAGPIEASEADEDDSVRVIVDESGEQLEGLMAFVGERKRAQRRAATPEEVATLNRRSTPALKVGDRVRWKKGMRSGEWPDEGEAVIVSQIIDPPIYDPNATEVSKGAQRNDMALAFVDGSEPPRIFEFVYDSRRFERVED